MNSKRVKAYACLVLYSLVVGFSFLGVKVALNAAEPILAMAYRFDVAFLAMLLLILFRVVKVHISLRNKAVIVSTIAYISFFGFQAYALNYSTSIVSGIIFALIPVITRFIAGVVLKESTNWRQNLFIMMSVTSVIILFAMSAGGGFKEATPLGYVLLVISCVCGASSNVFLRYVRDDYTPADLSFFITALGFVVFNILAVRGCLSNGGIQSYFEPFSDRTFIIVILYLGIMCTLISSWCLSYSLANVEAMNATIFGNLSTVISVIAGAVILKEPLHLYQVICALFVITGVFGVSYFGEKRKAKGIDA